MSLRRALGATLRALALWAMLGVPAAGAEVGDRVAWTDVRLHDGRVLKASELAGRTVVVQYWATWCPFCMKQNPHVQKLHQQHAGKKFLVLTVSIDKMPEAVTEYQKKRGYTFPAVMEGSQTRAWFPKRKGLPVMYVVDPAGRIVFHEAGEMFEEDILGLARYARN